MIYACAYSYALIVDWGFKRHIFVVFALSSCWSVCYNLAKYSRKLSWCPENFRRG